MNTLKIPYKTGETGAFIINDYRKQYSNCLRFYYNRVKESKYTEVELRSLKSKLLGINLMDSWFIQSSIYDAKALHASNETKEGSKPVIFGGRKNFLKRCKSMISKEEFEIKRLSPLYSVGESCNRSIKGNRKFRIEQDLDYITFKPNLKTKVKLILPDLRGSFKTTISKLYQLQEQHKIALTYRLDEKFIYVSYNELELTELSKQIENRFISIDQNPNYLGVSVVDWLNENKFNIVDTYVFDIKQINDKEQEFKLSKLKSSDSKRVKLSNKRRFETVEISKTLVDIAVHYQCSTFVLEELNFSKDKTKSYNKNFNRLVNNNWLRIKLIDNIKKRCNLHGIKVKEVQAQYSSIIGNTMFRELELPDMVLASLEISRRANLLNMMYVTKTIPVQKPYFFPKTELLEKTIKLLKSIEEFKLNYGKIDSWKQLSLELKNSKMMYRVSLTSNEVGVFQLNSYKSKVSVRKQRFIKSYNLL